MKITDATPTPTEGIAVIGMQGRFPGARNVEELWENLKNGVESITTFSEAELRAAGIDPSYINVPGYVNRGCVLEDIDLFDAGFFGYSARDAETMDPQQRIFMECAWESLERAGCDPDSYPGMIGVFGGSDQSSYLYQIYSSIDLSAYGYGGMMAIANDKDYLTTQVSYRLNLRGPSIAVQTSCSTSLVAVCVACQNLAHGYCDIALAGGVGIGVPQKRGYWYQPGGIVSPDGHCRAFDAEGQGTVVGNGVAVVVLKRLSDALADGDHIHAVIKGFALNNDGSAKVGYTAPSVDGQAQAIRIAQRMAGVEPDTIGYIETHGTATTLGDPIEVASLTKAFGERTNKRQFCAIASLKSNVGHLSSAAGISGLIKGVMVVENGQIPKSLHYEQPNPQIDFKRSPFFVASELMEWPLKNGQPRRAGVSSFGVGGTNAHVILEEAPKIEADPHASEKQLLVLSARTATALEAVTDKMVSYLESAPSVDLADVAFTGKVGRKAFSHRRAVVFDRSDREGLVTALKTRDPLRVNTAQSEIRDRGVVFMFSGQGTQHVNMGLELYEEEETFRNHVDECSDILMDEMGLDLRDILYPDSADEEAAAETLKQTAITQPALFTIEYSLARLWMEWGLKPRAMLGHSIGEYVAACLAGVMTLPEALSVVAMRGRLMDRMPGGSMLAVPLPEGALQPLLSPALSLAAVNAPSLCVLSGAAAAIDAVESSLTEQGLPCRRLHTSHAFHSSMMEPILKQFVDRIGRISLKPPRLPYLSNVTGSWITPELATSADYWASHLRQTVRFADNLTELMVFPDLAFVEVGPGQTLGVLARQQGSRASSHLFVSSLRSAQEQDAGSDMEFMRKAAGQLWLGGVEFDWRGFHTHEKRRVVSLPTYPFERQRFWLGPLEQVETATESADGQKPQTEMAFGTVTAAGPTGTLIVSPPVAVASKAEKNISDWFYVPNWKREVNAAGTSAKEETDGAWLVFEDSNGLGESVSKHLRTLGRKVTTVLRGDSFDERDGGYQLRVCEKSDYEALVKALQERKEFPARILHLWSADKPDSAESAIQSFAKAQSRSFFSLIYLAQALAKSGGASQVNLGVVTDSLQAVLGDEKLRSAEATVSAACKGIPQEYPNLRCRLIDVVSSQSGLADSLVRELTAEPFSAVVAYRNGSRWVQEFEPLRLEKKEQKSALLKDGDVYLITGGVGNIGLVLAEAIARQVKAKLVLTGRSPFPERTRWDEYVSSHATDQTSARIRKLKALEQLGAEVVVAQADVTNPEQMSAVIREVREKWGPIRGVIHGAANLTAEAFRHVREIDTKNGDSHFQPKAHGLLILEDILRDEPPQFFVLLSSISALLAGLGLTTYAAANAYLDAEAQRQNSNGSTHWLSINWDAWDFSPGVTPDDAISSQHGLDAFTRILNASLKQVVVAATPLPARLDKWVNLETIVSHRAAASMQAMAAAAGASSGNGNGTGASSNNGGGAGTSVHARPELSTQYVSPQSETEKTVAGVWEHLLGVAPIGIYDKFFELGGHSLLAIQLLARLREIFEIDLPVQRIFEAPTVFQLAESIERDKKAAPVKENLAPANGDNLAEMMSLVEGLSEAELDALLSEAEAIHKESHG
jgi:acyl transferase domain-containing protein/acyl carrier protein